MTNEFISNLAPYLLEYDAALAKQGVQLQARPFEIAVDLVLSGTLQVRPDGSKQIYEPKSATDFVVTDWFRTLYREIDDWYRDRFGDAFVSKREKVLRGIIFVSGTPFILEIPATRSRPHEQNGLVWVSFPDHVEDDDSPLDWLVIPPNFSSMGEELRHTAEHDAKKLSNDLRYIRTSHIATSGSSKVKSFGRSVITHLEAAADYLLVGDADSVQKGWWELQMAFESAIKGLVLQYAGRYPRTHKVEDLINEGRLAGLSVDQSEFNWWPRFSEISDMRYAQGARTDISELYKAYLSVVTLARKAVGAMMKAGLGNARFAIQAPPWMRH